MRFKKIFNGEYIPTKVAALGSSFMSGMGVYVSNPGIDGITQGACIALAFFFLLSAGWSTAFDIVKSNCKTTTKRYILIVSLLMGPAIGAISSQTNMIFMAGSSAHELVRDEYVGETEETTKVIYANAQEIYSMLPSVDALCHQFTQDAKLEFETGQFSSAPGTGAVHTSLSDTATALCTAAEALRTDMVLFTPKQQEINTLVDQMRSVLRSKNTGEFKQAKVSDLSLNLTSLLAELDKRNFASSLLDIISSSEASGMHVNQLSSSSKIKANQVAALGQLKAYIRSHSNALTTRLSTFRGKEVTIPGALEKMTMNAAVLKMWRNFLAVICISIAIDFFPYFLLLMYYFGTEGNSRKHAYEEEMRDMTAVELEMAKIVLKKLAERNSQDEVELISNDKDDNDDPDGGGDK